MGTDIQSGDIWALGGRRAPHTESTLSPAWKLPVRETSSKPARRAKKQWLHLPTTHKLPDG